LTIKSCTAQTVTSTTEEINVFVDYPNIDKKIVYNNKLNRLFANSDSTLCPITYSFETFSGAPDSGVGIKVIADEIDIDESELVLTYRDNYAYKV